MNPPIYSAVRAIGVLKPKFQNQQPGGPVFADSLDVRGTAFWLKNHKRPVISPTASIGYFCEACKI
jgi:hypothetical protein